MTQHTNTPQLKVRTAQPHLEARLQQQGLHPLLARLMAARGAVKPEEVQTRLQDLLNPLDMKGMAEAAEILADALEAGARIVVIGDYDCDGATATAVAVRGLRMLLAALGADEAACRYHIDFLVPNRFDYGYGLSPQIVRLAAEQFEPDLLVTVDNGIASVDGVREANDLGIGVLVTDHHLPGDTLPEALAIVNPNQPGCGFESKSIAGVGVMFYTLLATRAVLRDRGAFDAQSQPKIDQLLDLVALGTVADVVKLDANNRRLVAHGLKRIRQAQAQPGLLALFNEAGRDHRKAVATDLGFSIGPRLNAAGRLSDMTIGIRTLITDDAAEASQLAAQLGQMNEERKRIEESMKRDALADIEAFVSSDNPAAGVVVAHDSWHQGVIGILASRIKEKLYRPTIALAPGDAGQWKGSGRSVPGVHLRDVLDLVSKRLPEGAMPKFGGHAMAAGLTLDGQYLEQFKLAFAQAVLDLSDPSALTQTVETDGSIPADYIVGQAADLLETQVWGQGFPPPLFHDEFEVLEHRLLKNAHSKFTLRRDGKTFTALRWRSVEPLPHKVRIAYRFERDTFQGGEAVQLIVEHVL
ncbi:single-stranded-DNA-specific exonuclease RecJ [Limnobacter humi]|uniref:Single-stranded-DNA-specific exonuclease RecJ n=1 Tax=Limnobacter humi TaxID=1778671 RepID=A0ABT1WIR5_9BURK|nr:single-stranded-DNA-specific exonuclease RecJ [Limnobacter humi]MCQ8897299.1 single-stranded-DNA-specific exonuclease RecJ [Limnobacter humi]